MLPGVRPAHTRQSFSSRSRLYVEKHVPTVEDFIHLDDTGLWLLPSVIAERDRRVGEEHLSAQAEVQREHEMNAHADRTKKAALILGRTSVTETGCMVDGLRANQEPFEWAMEFASAEWGGIVLTTPEDMPHVQICDTEGCYNSRHFDIDFGRLTLKERKVEVNPNWYVTQPDESIKTIWGDRLPSVKDSLEYFVKFQKKNYPFVPIEKSKLTATSISQIRFQPVTGCWEAWSYYTKPDDNLNWQFDGYGRLYQKLTQKVDKETGEILSKQRRGHWMAHRVVWLATGRRLIPDMVLNHLCSYRRCCNPLHIKQETFGQNTSHGVRVQRAMNALKAIDPEVESSFMTAAELAPYHQAALELYHKLAA